MINKDNSSKEYQMMKPLKIFFTNLTIIKLMNGNVKKLPLTVQSEMVDS